MYPAALQRDFCILRVYLVDWKQEDFQRPEDFCGAQRLRSNRKIKGCDCPHFAIAVRLFLRRWHSCEASA